MYRETVCDGRLHRRHYNGARSAGRMSLQEQMTKILRAVPDSDHWRAEADLEVYRLQQTLGDNYALFAEIVWPGESIQSLSYMQIAETARNYLETAHQHRWDVLNCTCNGISEFCPVCQAAERLRSQSSI